MNTKSDIYKRINKDGPIPKHIPKLGKCWEWIGNRQNLGYGIVSFEGRFMLVHRLLYEFEVGPIEKVQILHKCDNPACCRPAHLFSGSASDNMHDMWNKNRHIRPIGRRNNHAILTEEQVLKIRSEYVPGKTRQVDLAKKYSVTQGNVSAILRRETWTFI